VNQLTIMGAALCHKKVGDPRAMPKDAEHVIIQVQNLLDI
jgi:hypothetical protein